MAPALSDSPTGVILATTEDDAEAIDAMVAHHAILASTLNARVAALLAAATANTAHDTSSVAEEQQGLVDFCTDELLPHAAAEEATLYGAAAADPRARLLIEAMTDEHRVLESLVNDVQQADSPTTAAAKASALRVLFEVHLTKENDLILPLVASSPTMSLSSILTGMQELLSAGRRSEPSAHEPVTPAASGGGHRCGCGGSDDHDALVLDLRDVPHAIRHATAFGAVSAVHVSEALVLVAPHDPLPLLAQLEAREPGAFTVTYDDRGPDAWRVRLTRTR